jgi:hypothetical protein
MNYRPIIVIAVIALIAFVGVLFMLQPADTKSPATQPPVGSGSNLGGYYGTVTATNSGGSTPGQGGVTADQGVSTVDLQGAYNSLFEKLLARRVNFARVSSGDIYALYAGEVAQSKGWYPDAADLSIGVAMEDVTDDGVPEALVLDDLPGSCGVAGCPFTIYQKTRTAWKGIFSAQIQSELGLANAITNGHTDLFLVQQGNTAPYQSAVRRYVWDGAKYAYKELSAGWDGKTFVIYGQ